MSYLFMFMNATQSIKSYEKLEKERIELISIQNDIMLNENENKLSSINEEMDKLDKRISELDKGFTEIKEKDLEWDKGIYSLVDPK